MLWDSHLVQQNVYINVNTMRDVDMSTNIQIC